MDEWWSGWSGVKGNVWISATSRTRLHRYSHLSRNPVTSIIIDTWFACTYKTTPWPPPTNPIQKGCKRWWSNNFDLVATLGLLLFWLSNPSAISLLSQPLLYVQMCLCTCNEQDSSSCNKRLHVRIKKIHPAFQHLSSSSLTWNDFSYIPGTWYLVPGPPILRRVPVPSTGK